MATGTLSYSYLASLFGGVNHLIRSTDGAAVPCDLENMDYQAFLLWVGEGNPAPEGWTGPYNPPVAT